MAALAFLGTLGLGSSFCVIGGSFLGVSEYLIGLIDLHEDCLGPRVLVLVGWYLSAIRRKALLISSREAVGGTSRNL